MLLEMSAPRSIVSVVVVSYNDEAFLKRLLDSLEKQTYRDFETIVVDNAANPSIRRLVVSRGVRYVASSNTGYTGGNNLGARYAKGDLILILNPDTWLEPSAIESLVTFFARADRRCMVASPKVMIRDSDLINSVGMRHFRRWVNMYSNVGYLEKDRGQYDIPSRAEAFDGAAFMFRRELLDETYLFNPCFFAGADSTDLAERVIKLGYEIWTCPQSTIHHEIHGSYCDDPLNVRPRMVRNNLAHTMANLGLGSFIMTVLAIMHFCIVQVRKGQLFTSKQYFFGVLQFLLNSGTLICSSRAMALKPFDARPLRQTDSSQSQRRT